MTLRNLKIGIAATLAAATLTGLLLVEGCGNDTTDPAGSAVAPAAVTQLYAKYGGYPTVMALVTDTVTSLIADCSQNPYFTTILNTNGHDTTDKLQSCLDLFFVAKLGGPAIYPGNSSYRNAPAGGYVCEDLTVIHAGLGVTLEVFNQFITDFGVVAANHGVQAQDIATIGAALAGYQGDIVAAVGEQISYDYTPTSPAGNGCTVVPSPSPSPSASPSPSPSASPSLPAPSSSPSVTPTTAPTTVAATIPSGATGMGTHAYDPDPLNVTVGSTVIWTNADSIAHTVTANDGSFNSGPIQPGATYSHTFSAAGTFPYYCTIHGQVSMNGTVIVQ